MDAIMDQINRRLQLPENAVIKENFASAAVLLNTVRIEIGLLDISPEKQLLFRKRIVDSQYLIFVKSGRLLL